MCHRLSDRWKATGGDRIVVLDRVLHSQASSREALWLTVPFLMSIAVRFLAKQVVFPRRRRSFWKIMILSGWSFAMLI